MSAPSLASERTALRLQLVGRVQGLGVRPAVARLAQRLELAGSVRNTLQGLEIEIEGAEAEVAMFQARLLAALPNGCSVREHSAELIPVQDRIGFVIERDDSIRPLTTCVPPDMAVCSECLAESRSPSDRRAGYALISCAACGPRYSVIRTMPYERGDTSLAEFPPCPVCTEEYSSPEDRRFHAQTIACADCGPEIRAVNAGRQVIGARCDAVAAATAALRDGWTVALRGVGGYQLLCDATNETAVARLRARKSRPAKPLALLVPSVACAEQFAFVDNAERRELVSPVNPIVLLRRKGTAALAQSIHPGLNTVGIMLPTTALHDQLVHGFGGPLVCTSGNTEGDPLEYEPAAAERNLAGIADLWLHHDRPIERPIDDSVVRVIAGRPVTIRLARGLAPLSLELPADRTFMALGGHQKSAIAWCNGQQCVLGPHIGDLETLSARERFVQHISSIEQLYRFVPDAYACDRHPGYFTSEWGMNAGAPCSDVPHHQAHVAAGMLEHGLLNERVLGVAFDGTGLGADGTIWGGEFLLAQHASRMERVAHLRPFVLPGGEAAIREPWRVTVSVLQQAIGADAIATHGLGPVARGRIVPLLQLLDRTQLHTVTTSAGRLFDAAACLILGIAVAQFDGEPAMRLEDAADPADTQQYPFPLIAGEPQQLDWRPLFDALYNDCRSQVSPGAMAMRFHRAIAAGIAAVIREWPGLPVVLGGGVFQNRLLSELVVAELNDERRLCLPGNIPPNDGGLAAGQLAIALARYPSST
ncbi:MAG: carbamoyltransferase HypF [Planctomycetaceae bacterium]|nr:carbamoyltransferase HypF [Planctomycetaceae bacterium]